MFQNYQNYKKIKTLKEIIMSGIGIITNPYSKKNIKTPGHKIMMGYILGNRGHYKITESLEDLSKVAEEFKSQEIDILGINGGDGTIQKTITTFISVYGKDKLPKIALLRGGTMNVIANNLNIKGSSKTLLLDLVEKYHAADPFDYAKLQTIKCNDQYGFIFTSGFASNFLEEYYKNKSGPLGAIFFAIKLALGIFRKNSLIHQITKPATLTIQGKTLPETSNTSNTILISTLNYLPLRLKLFNRIKKGMKRFQAFFINRRPFELVKLVLNVFFRLPLNKKNIIELLSDEIILSSDQGILVGLDGDLFGEQKNVRISLGPELTFILNGKY